MEILADRLLWDRTANGIRVIVPAPRDWKILFFAVWLAGWTIGGRFAARQVVRSYAVGKIDWFTSLWLIGWAFGECFVASAILWAVGGQTLLRLDPATLQIEWSLFGVRLNTRTLSTADVRNLRYCPAVSKGRSSVASRISFESADRTISFAAGISDAEAFALLDKMLEVYTFPKERALEYLDLSR